MVVRLVEAYGYEPIAPEAVITTVQAVQGLSAEQYSGSTSAQKSQIQAIDTLSKQGFPEKEIEQIMTGQKDPYASFPTDVPTQEQMSWWEVTKEAWQRGWEQTLQRAALPAEEGGVIKPGDIVASWEESFAKLPGEIVETITPIPLRPKDPAEVSAEDWLGKLGLMDILKIGGLAFAASFLLPSIIRGFRK